MVFILSALWWIQIRGLWKITDGTEWLWGKLGLILMGGAVHSKFLTQFSVDGWGCIPSLLFDLRPNYGGGNEDNSDLLQKAPCIHMLSAPNLAAGHRQPMPLNYTSPFAMTRLWSMEGEGSVYLHKRGKTQFQHGEGTQSSIRVFVLNVRSSSQISPPRTWFTDGTQHSSVG